VKQEFKIFCLVPDLPAPADIVSICEEIHRNRWYTNFGPIATRFESAMAKFVGRIEGESLGAACFSSATTALELMLRAMQLPKGGKILIPALTFPATALAVINAGFEPVLGDVDANHWCLTADTALAVHKRSQLACVMPVSTFGRPLDTKSWLEFQADTGVPVLLDVAASLGQQSIPEGLSAVFSLHATKPFGVGEGGLAVTSDKELLARARSLSNFGFKGSAGVVQAIGTNAKFSEYYAAVGLRQLERWSDLEQRRKQVLGCYLKRITCLGGQVELQDGIGDFVPAVFSVAVNGANAGLQAAFANAAVQTRFWYLPLLNLHPALSDLQVSGGLQNSEYLARSLIGLPFHSFLSENDISKVCRILSDSV
jgi:dTDP-4-amino-4,6-dideoxygalactose transaminase